MAISIDLAIKKALRASGIESPVVDSAYDFKDLYVFNVLPAGSRDELMFGTMYRVNKRTGKVSPFNPIPVIKEFRSKAVEIEV